MRRALDLLEQSHGNRENRNALIHGNLFPDVIYLPQNEDDLPVISSFGNFTFGPAGIDLGLFLSSYVFYYACHSRPSCRRALRQGVGEVLSSYFSAFSVLTRGEKNDYATVNSVLRDILVDSVGYLGLGLLRLSLSSSDRNSHLGFSYKQREFQWGDFEGKIASVKKRKR